MIDYHSQYNHCIKKPFSFLLEHYNKNEPCLWTHYPELSNTERVRKFAGHEVSSRLLNLRDLMRLSR